MNTYFAPAERADEKRLQAEIEFVNKSPVIEGLLHSVSGMLAVLNVHRQVVALKTSFLEILGIGDPQQALGLRPGEAVKCIHAHETQGGCGTTKYCSTCGAAIAIVSSLGLNKAVERICALTINRAGIEVDISFSVRSNPIIIDGNRFLLLFLQDITRQQQWAALEKFFFHDINNMFAGLLAASEMLVAENPNSDLAKTIHQLSLRLVKEVAIQKCLFQSEACDYLPLRYEVSVEQILEELKNIYANHPASLNKKLRLPQSFPNLSLNTDISLLMRVLCNMVTNAFEATSENGEVRVWIEPDEKTLSFCVWNQKSISEDIARRIFQRHFSTEDEIGRGLGTYSIKLFGEKFLGGKVNFTSSEKEGTIFRIVLPY
jgi:signal transduction histidine kinase